MESEHDDMKPEVLVKFTDNENWILTICFSPDQTKLCSAGYERKVVLKNVKNYQTENVYLGHEGPIYGSDFSHKSFFLATGSSDEVILIWNVSGTESGNPTRLEGHVADVNSVRYCRKDPNHIISGSDDKTIKFWNIEQKKVISTLYGCKGIVFGVDILPDNQTIVSGDSDDVRIFDLRSGKMVRYMNIHQSNVRSVQFHPNSLSFASGSSDETIKIVDIRTYKILQNYNEDYSCVFSVCFHPSGRYLLSGNGDKLIKVFDLSKELEEPTTTEEEEIKRKDSIFSLKGHSGTIRCVQFSPDGKYFASGSYDKNVFLWDFPLGRMKLWSDFKDTDEEERVNYLIDQDLIIGEEEEEEEGDSVCCSERNILKIRIDNFLSLYSYKFFFL